MKKIGLVIVFSLVLFLMFSCSMEISNEIKEDNPIVQEPVEEKGAEVRIKINTPSLTSRTILPDNDDLVRANWYEVRLESLDDPDLAYTQSVSAEKGEAEVQFENVLIGTYIVTGEAYIKNGEATKVLLYKGRSSENLKVEVDGTNTATIILESLNYGNGLTGGVSVSINWTDASKMEGVIKEVVSKYPLSIKFFYADDYTENGFKPEYSQLGETIIAPVGTTSVHYEKHGIPVTGKGIGYFGIYYTVEETEYLLLTLGSDIVQIYSGQVSVPDNGDLYIVTNNNIPSVINEVRLSLGYGEDPTKNLLVSWRNTDDHGSLLYDRISLKLYDVSNGRNLVEQRIIDLREKTSSDMSYQFEAEMVKGHKYVVYATGRTPYGRETKTFVSNTFQSKVLVESVDIDESYISGSYMTNGESVVVSATVNPFDATDKGLCWSFEDDLFDVVSNDNDSNKVTLIAKKPGRTKVTATSLDNPELSDTSEKTISIRLRKPESPMCEVLEVDGGKKIRVYWSVNDSWAESYSVYRVVDGVAEENSVAVVDNVGDSVNSYDDENIVAGKSYSYFVKADNSTLTTAYFNPESEASEQSAAITPVVPTITFVQPTIKNFNLTISNSTGSASDILVTEEEPQTLFIPNPIEGIEKYTWLVNGAVIKTGTYESCSSITLTSDMSAVEIRGGDANTLTLIGETHDGNAYSSTIYFRVVTVKDERVEISNAISSIDINDGTYLLDAYVYPINATMQDITYSSSNEGVASIDSKGLITLKGIGHATITASCTYGASAVVELDVYNPLTDAKALIKMLNSSLKSVISDADASFGRDWWPGETPNTYNYENGKIKISSPENASQSPGRIDITNFFVDDGFYGTVTFDTTTSIKLYASDGGGIWQKGYLGDDPLHYIGYNNEGLVRVTLPYGQGSATIQFNAIDVQNKSGSYTVTFEGRESEEILYSEMVSEYPLI